MNVTRIIINRERDKLENGFFIVDEESQTVTAVDYDTAEKMVEYAVGKLDRLIAEWRIYNSGYCGDFIFFVRR